MHGLSGALFVCGDGWALYATPWWNGEGPLVVQLGDRRFRGLVDDWTGELADDCATWVDVVRKTICARLLHSPTTRRAASPPPGA